MPSVFRRAINAVKDQTSISLAKLNASLGDLDVAILKATSHDEDIPNDRHIAQVIALVISSTRAAAACVRALARRISRTRNYTVALKSLIITHHALCKGGSYFSLEAAELCAPGCLRFLDLSNFSTSLSASCSPWDYTAFIRTYARYLDTRLESAMEGKLRNLNFRGRMAVNLVNSMTPSVALVHIEHWQRLLDRAISMRPTGPACHNRLVQVALYMVVRETFDLYRDISAALNLLLDKIFSLDKKFRLKTLEACQVAGKQFEELDSFYSICIRIGVGRITEYPRVQMISETLVKNLEEYLLDTNDTSGESSRQVGLQNQPSLSLHTPVRHESRDFMSDSDSIMSEPITARRNKTPATLNEENRHISSSLSLLDRRQEATRESSSERWELISNSENLSFYSQEMKMIDDNNRSFAENYNNPFLQGSLNFEKANELKQNRRSPTVRSGHASSSNSSRTLGLTRQQLILQEQRRWREQQECVLRIMDDNE